MPIKKQFIKSKPVCKVTFSIDAKAATTAAVIGDFNNWDQKAGELGKLKNGNFKASFNLPTAASYEFKYIVDGAFVNEAEADSFQWNEFAGAENSVLAL
jgi:1,4-alpha-glucan branching enzyme